MGGGPVAWKQATSFHKGPDEVGRRHNRHGHTSISISSHCGCFLTSTALESTALSTR